MKIRFTKMHGLGNDFVVIDAVSRPLADFSVAQLRYLSDRNFGVGCDQILWVAPAQQAGVDFAYRIFNADGSEVQQCGNGARCFARFVRDKGLTDKDIITVETLAGIIQLHIQPDGQVTVNMGAPRFAPEALPFQAEQKALYYPIEIEEEIYHIGAVSMGNPHAVLLVDNVDDAPVAQVGALLESHPRFPQRVNVGFLQVVDAKHARLRVFERGAGETLACGTGACAAAVIGQRWGKLAHQVTLQLRGGTLQIAWDGDEQSPVWMTGAAVTVFEGEIELPV